MLLQPLKHPLHVHAGACAQRAARIRRLRRRSSQRSLHHLPLRRRQRNDGLGSAMLVCNQPRLVLLRADLAPVLRPASSARCEVVHRSMLARSPIKSRRLHVRAKLRVSAVEHADPHATRALDDRVGRHVQMHIASVAVACAELLTRHGEPAVLAVANEHRPLARPDEDSAALAHIHRHLSNASRYSARSTAQRRPWCRSTK